MALKVGELYASFGIDTSGIDSAISGIEQKCAGIASTLAKTGAGLSLALTTPIVAFGKDVFKVGTEFEAQMSRVQGISGATAAELELLTQTAKDLGAASVFSASEAAQGMEYLASAGFDVNEIIAAMPGMLDLAAASGEDLATSAEIAASMLNGFGLEASEAGHVADVLAETAARTNAGVYDMGEAMKYVAPVANAMGLSMEETAAAIGIMSDAGIKGSQAGTTLRAALSRMAKPTEVMQTKMDELGISFYDSGGNMKSITEIVGMLQTSFVGLTDEQRQNALVTLFGQEALSGWMVLLEAGPEALAEMTEGLENCDGAAQNMADTMLDNLKGAIEGFSGSLETAKLNLYDSFAPAMQTAVEAATEGVDAFNLLDESSKQVVYKVTALAAAAGPAMVALGGVVGAVGKLIPALTALASPIGVVAGGLALFAVAAIDANNDIGKAFAKMSKKATKALKGLNAKIPDAMKTVSKRLPALCASLTEGIQEIVPEFVSTAMLAITGFVDTITDNAANIADVGESIIVGVVGGISKNLPKLIKSGAEMMVSIGSALIRNIPSLVESVGSIAAAIWDGIVGTDWLALGTEIVAAIGDALSGLVDLFTGWFEDAKEAVKAVEWGEIWNTIKGAFKVSSTWLKNLILGDAATDSSTWKDVGAKIWGWIKSGVSVTGDWIKGLVLGDSFTPDSSWGDVGSKLWESIKGGFSATGDWIKQLVLGESYTADASWSDVGLTLWEAVQSGFSAVGDWIKGLVLGESYTPDSSWSDVGEAIWEKVQSGIEKFKGLKESLGTAAQNIASWLGEKLAGLDADTLAAKLGDLSTIATSIADAIVNSKVDFITQAGTILTTLTNGFSSFDWSALSGVFTSVAKSIISSIVGGITALGTVAEDILGAIATLLSGETVSSAFGVLTDVATAIIQAIVDAIPSLTETAKGIIVAIGTVLKSVPWSTIGSELGDLATSLIDALLSAVQSLSSGDFSSLITSIGDGLVSAAAGLATAASTLVGELVAYLIDPANLAEIAQVGVQFVAELVKGIIGLGTTLIDGAASVMSNALIGFFRGLFGIEIDPYVEQMVNDFFDMEFDVPVDTFDGYGKACGYALVSAMEGAFTDTSMLTDAITAWGIVVENGYSQFFPEFEYLGNETVMKLYSGMLNGFETQGTSVEQSAREAALLIGLGYGENLENALWSKQPEVSDALYELLDGSYIDLTTLAGELGYDIGEMMGFQLPEGYSMALIDGTPTVVSQSQALIAAGEQAIADGWTVDEIMAGLWDHTFSTSFSEIKEWQPELTGLLEDMGIEAGSLLGVALPDGVAQGLKDGTISVEQAAAQIAAAAVLAQDDVQSAVTDNTAKGEEAGDAVATGQDNAAPAVETASGGLHDTIVEAYTPLPEELSATTQEAMSGLETAILDGQSPAQAAAQTVADAAVQEFVLKMSAENAAAIGSAWVQSLGDSISTTADGALYGVVQTIATATLNYTQSILSPAAGTMVGVQFMQGILTAFGSMSGTLRSTAQSIAQSTVDVTKNILSYSAGNSIGYQFDNGIAAGIRSGSSAITSAARSAAQAALNAAKSTLGINSPSVRAKKEVGWMYDAGIAEGVLGKIGLIRNAADKVTTAMHESFLVGDPSRGTVYTSGDTIRQTARQTAEANNEKQSMLERAEAIGRSIADRLIESGALDGDIYMDNEKVGEKVTKPVSKNIAKKTRQTVKGRTAQGVIA